MQTEQAFAHLDNAIPTRLCHFPPRHRLSNSASLPNFPTFPTFPPLRPPKYHANFLHLKLRVLVSRHVRSRNRYFANRVASREREREREKNRLTWYLFFNEDTQNRMVGSAARLEKREATCKLGELAAKAIDSLVAETIRASVYPRENGFKPSRHRSRWPFVGRSTSRRLAPRRLSTRESLIFPPRFGQSLPARPPTLVERTLGLGIREVHPL